MDTYLVWRCIAELFLFILHQFNELNLQLEAFFEHFI